MKLIEDILFLIIGLFLLPFYPFLKRAKTMIDKFQIRETVIVVMTDGHGKKHFIKKEG